MVWYSRSDFSHHPFSNPINNHQLGQNIFLPQILSTLQNRPGFSKSNPSQHVASLHLSSKSFGPLPISRLTLLRNVVLHAGSLHLQQLLLQLLYSQYLLCDKCNCLPEYTFPSLVWPISIRNVLFSQRHEYNRLWWYYTIKPSLNFILHYRSISIHCCFWLYSQLTS